MFKHYFRITFRNMWKYKAQSLTGIFGLAFSIACFVPALYWLHYETSYDCFYPDSKHIYRVYSVDKQKGMVNEHVSGILERKLHEQLPAMQTSTVFFIEQNDCRSEETPHIRLRTVFTDSTFLNVFPQVVVSGETQQPLQITNNIIITETVAVRLFGDVEKAIGQQIKSTMLNDMPYTITAVVKDPPPNTNLSFHAILFHEQIKLQKSFVERSPEQVWTFATLQMYMRLHPQADVDRLAEQLRNFPLQAYTNANVEIEMMPVSDVRHQLNTDVPFTLNFIRLFVAAGILLLFSALFNFLNLHLDLFRQRICELNLRAIHGATGGQLIRQMLFELASAILLSLVPAFCFIIIVRPIFSGLLGITMEMSQLINLFIICGISLVLLMLFISFLTFWRLSHLAIQPPLKGKTTGQPALRHIAVTLQFAVSIIFIIATSVVMMQMRFVNHKDLGFDSKGIIHLSGLHFFIDNNVRTALIDKLASIPQIESITDAFFEPQHDANSFQMKTDVEWPGKQQSDKPAFYFIATDNRFAKTFGINILMGKWLDEGGMNQIILNEEAVRVMELNEPVGAIIRISLDSKNMQEFRVMGVVNDFHTLSLRSRIHPTIFMISISPSNSLYLRTTPGQEQEAIQRITDILPSIHPTFVDVHPIPLDELYNRLNYSEQAGLQLFSVLAIVCLLISLFGIYAVATASTQRRRKEIAIRKVTGAEVVDIVRMFFREYILLVIIASLFALPLAYITMSNWLQGYAYRTNIPWWLLLGVVTGVVAVVLLTVLGQVLKAANSNPAEVVKSE